MKRRSFFQLLAAGFALLVKGCVMPPIQPYKNAWLTENGEPWLTEDGKPWLIE